MKLNEVFQNNLSKITDIKLAESYEDSELWADLRDAIESEHWDLADNNYLMLRYDTDLLDFTEMLCHNVDKQALHTFLERKKDDYIVEILELMKSNWSENAADIVKVLKKYGVNWPELQVIERALRADNYMTEDDNELYTGWNDPSDFDMHDWNVDTGMMYIAELIDAVKRNSTMEVEYYFDKAYENLQISTITKEISNHINPTSEQDKDLYIGTILRIMKKGDDLECAKVFLNAIKMNNVNWPEVKVLDRALQSVNEAYNRRFNKMIIERGEDIDLEEMISDAETCFQRAATDPQAISKAMRNLYEYINNFGNEDRAVKLVEDYREEIQKYFIENLGFKYAIDQARHLISIGIEWPIVYLVTSQIKTVDNKDAAIKILLTRLKDGRPLVVAGAIKALRELGKDWSELDVIERALKASKSINEDQDNKSKTGYQKFLLKKADNNLSFHNDHRHIMVVSGVKCLVDYIAEGGDKKTAINLATTYKNTILTYILNTIKTYSNRYYLHQMSGLIKDIRLIGVNWSELDIIEHAINANKNLTENDEYTDAQDSIYQMFKRSVERLGVWYVVNQMTNSKINFEKIPQSRTIFDDAKTEIIQDLLRNVKAEDGGFANRRISQLIDIGVNWPELKVIRKSILADRAIRMADEPQIQNEDDENSNATELKGYLDQAIADFSKGYAGTAIAKARKYKEAGGDLANVKPFFDKYKDSVIKYVTGLIQTGEFEGILRIVDFIKQSGVDWPEFDDFINYYKDEIMKVWLRHIRDGSYYVSKKFLDELEPLNVQWPELPILKKTTVTLKK